MSRYKSDGLVLDDYILGCKSSKLKDGLGSNQILVRVKCMHCPGAWQCSWNEVATF